MVGRETHVGKGKGEGGGNPPVAFTINTPSTQTKNLSSVLSMKVWQNHEFCCFLTPYPPFFPLLSTHLDLGAHVWVDGDEKEEEGRKESSTHTVIIVLPLRVAARQEGRNYFFFAEKVVLSSHVCKFPI